MDECDAKMPFKFTDTLEKVQIKLGPNELTPQQRGELEQLKSDFALAVQCPNPGWKMPASGTFRTSDAHLTNVHCWGVERT